MNSTTRRRRDLERGDSALEVALVFPLLLLMLLVIVQLALRAYANNIAQAAAEEGLAATAAYNGSTNEGRRRIEEHLANTGRNLLRDAKVQVSRTDGRASVRVSGRGLELVPGLATVEADAVAPVERFVPTGERP